MHLLPLDRDCLPLDKIVSPCMIYTPHVRSSLELTVSLQVDMGFAHNRQGNNLDPWAVEIHSGSCMRCTSLTVAGSVQTQSGSVFLAIQLPLLIARSMTAHLCLAAALCLVAACSALERHGPHLQP